MVTLKKISVIDLIKIYLLVVNTVGVVSAGRFDDLLWPLPQNVNSSTSLYFINSQNFAFHQTQFESELLGRAFQRYNAILFSTSNKQKVSRSSSLAEQIDPSLLITSIDVYVDSLDESLSLDTDESYTLQVETPTVQLRAQTVYGALRGLETFSQLVVYFQESFYQVNETTIQDSPRFTHRGFLVDTARHFLSLNVLYKILDAMAYTKMNVFHWHIVDEESFPYESIIYPKLALEGSWNGRQDHIYTQGDIKAIINYAKDRGIRVIPEFDSPGHTRAWGKGYPFLLTQCYFPNSDEPKTGNDGIGPINPTANTTFPFLRDLFSEISEVFPDKYLHVGGDEVHFECWQSNPAIREWMQQHNYNSYASLEQYYLTNVLNIVSSLNKEYIVWQEVYDNGLELEPNTVIHVWKGNWEYELRQITKQGFKAILSSPWYLNYISYGSDWENYYNADPLSFGGTKSQKSLVAGGEACMWGEYVDSTNAVTRIWPRAASVAERLWSNENTRDIESARKRILVLTCRLISRGIEAEPITGASFCSSEWDPPYLPPWSLVQ